MHTCAHWIATHTEALIGGGLIALAVILVLATGLGAMFLVANAGPMVDDWEIDQ